MAKKIRQGKLQSGQGYSISREKSGPLTTSTSEVKGGSGVVRRTKQRNPSRLSDKVTSTTTRTRSGRSNGMAYSAERKTVKGSDSGIHVDKRTGVSGNGQVSNKTTVSGNPGHTVVGRARNPRMTGAIETARISKKGVNGAKHANQLTKSYIKARTLPKAK